MLWKCRNSKRRSSLYDNVNFHITNFPFLSTNIPSAPAYGDFVSQLIRYTTACSTYECFILRAVQLSNKLLGQGYVKERLKSYLSSTVGTGSSQYPPLRNVTRHSQDDHIQWHLPLIRHNTSIWPCYWCGPNSLTSYLTVQGLHKTFTTGAACQQRTLTSPDTWFCPTLGFACVLMLRPISPELALFLDYRDSSLLCIVSVLKVNHPLLYNDDTLTHVTYFPLALVRVIVPMKWVSRSRWCKQTVGEIETDQCTPN